MPHVERGLCENTCAPRAAPRGSARFVTTALPLQSCCLAVALSHPSALPHVAPLLQCQRVVVTSQCKGIAGNAAGVAETRPFEHRGLRCDNKQGTVRTERGSEVAQRGRRYHTAQQATVLADQDAPARQRMAGSAERRTCGMCPRVFDGVPRFSRNVEFH
jgi:hypothetical protein